MADKGFKEAYFIVQDMRKCNASDYWQPQEKLYNIHYNCEFKVWTEAGKWGEAVTVKSSKMWRDKLNIVSQLIIQCAVPEVMRPYGDNALSAAQSRLSVILTPLITATDKQMSGIVADHGPVPSTNQLGLCAHPVDVVDQTVSVAPPDKHHKLAMCMWAADSYKDRYGVEYSANVAQTPEWLEYHLHVGVEHFYVYDNSDTERGSLWKLLQPYVKEGLVTYIRWTHKVCVPKRLVGVFHKGPYAHRSSQYAAGSSCLRRYAQYNDWMAFFDVDEYLIPAGLGRPAKSRLPTTLTGVLAPYSTDPDVYAVSFTHTFHQPCGNPSDPEAHTQPMRQKGTGHRNFYMRTADDVGNYRRPGAQGNNAALFMDAYTCTHPTDRDGIIPNEYCSRDKKTPCPPGHTRRSSVGVKQAVKPYKVLFHWVHYSVVTYDDRTPFNLFQRQQRHAGKRDPTRLLEMHSEAKMLHFRGQNAHIEGNAPDQNLTNFWLPEMLRVVQQPQAAKRLQAVHNSLTGSPLDPASAAQPQQQSTILKSSQQISQAIGAETRPQIAVRGMKVRSEVIQWDAHHPDSDVVLAMASGYGMNEWRLFVGTLRRTGFVGDICIAVGKKDLQNAELVKYAKRMQIIIYALDLDCHKAGRASACRIKDFYEQDQEDYTPVSNSRFQIYMALIQIYHKSSVAFVADFRDLFFVHDPFPLFRAELKSYNADILVFEEAKELSIGMRGNNNGWNTKWIEACYGKSVLSELQGKRVFCSGTTAGLTSGMFTYFDAMINELTRLKCSTVPGADQGMHNYLIHTKSVKSGSDDKPLIIQSSLQGEGPVNTLSALFRLRGPLASLGLIDEEGFVLNEDKKVRSAVVHQWDRDPQLKKWTQQYLLPILRKET